MKGLPCNLEVEKELLGSILIKSENIVDAIGVISADDFYKTAHKMIFQGMEAMFKKNKKIDIVTLSEELKDVLKDIGGITYISELAGSVVGSNVKEYAEIIKEKSNKRKLIITINKFIERCFLDKEPSRELVNSIEEDLFKINLNKENRMEPLKSILNSTIENIESVYNKGSDITGIDTGFRAINRMTGGLQKHDFIVIAARPSMGKTTFAVNMATTIAERKSVAIFSLEMSKEQLAKKVIASSAFIELKKLNNGKLDSKDWADIGKISGPLSKKKMVIDDTASITVQEIKAKCKKMKMQKGLDLIVVDYLQLMMGNAENRNQEISKISRGLKGIAKDLDVTIIAISQLSRAPEMRPNHRPILADLRESGAIEQDADIVMFLYRDDYYNSDTEEKNIAECIFAKNRNGEVGTVKLAWIPKYQKFGDLDFVHEGTYNPEIFEKKSNFEQKSFIK